MNNDVSVELDIFSAVSANRINTYDGILIDRYYNPVLVILIWLVLYLTIPGTHEDGVVSG